MSLERVVRPYQSLKVTPSVRVYDPNAKEAEDVVLNVGDASGSPKTLTGSFSSNTTYYCDQKGRGGATETTTRRVTNPEDDGQYVDMEVINKTSYKEGGGQQYQKVTQTFKEPPSSEVSKIIKKNTYDGG